MKPQWEPNIQQFEAAATSYRAVTPRLPTSFPSSQGVVTPTDELTAFLEESFALLKETNERTDVNAVLLGIHQPGVLNSISQMVSAVSALQSNPVPPYLDQIAQSLWSMRASIVWLIAPRPPEFSAADIQAQSASLRTLSTDFSKALTRSMEETQLISTQLKQATASVEEIKAHEREAATARINSESSATTAAANKDAVATTLGALIEGTTKYQTLLASIDDLQRKAQSTLESTSKVALAAAFSDRKTSLSREKLGWLGAFGIGILGLFAVAIATQLGTLNLPTIFKDNIFQVGPFLLRLFFVGPLVWFTWFAARQYGNTTRLIEDYAFKEASALAFVGYQREMSGDGEMIKLLRESAIGNFGSQPIRIFDKADPSSPAHELLSKAIDKGVLEKLIDLVKSLKK